MTYPAAVYWAMGPCWVCAAVSGFVPGMVLKTFDKRKNLCYSYPNSREGDTLMNRSGFLYSYRNGLYYYYYKLFCVGVQVVPKPPQR